MSSASTVRLVMLREVRQRLHSLGFFIFTGLLCFGIITIGIVKRTLGEDGPARYQMAVIGAAPAGFADAVREVAQSLGIEIRVDSVGSRSAAEQQLRSGELDIVIDPTAGQLISRSKPPDQLAASANTAWRLSKATAAARSAALDDQQISSILSPAPLVPDFLQPGRNSTGNVAMIVGTAAAAMLFVTISAFGGMVLTGVVEEKSTGVVEVLLSHVRAHQLLAGKVFGIGAVAMTQFGAALLSGLIALRISGITVPGAVWIGLPTTILWFIVGFVLYSTLFALAGSFVSRQEDAQGAAAPISMVFTAAYLTVFALGNSPYATTTRIVSMLPPFAPLLMPLRIATGAASVFEIGLSAVLLLAATYAMLRLAGAVYGRTLLHRGARLSWREALRMTSS